MYSDKAVYMNVDANVVARSLRVLIYKFAWKLTWTDEEHSISDNDANAVLIHNDRYDCSGD